MIKRLSVSCFRNYQEKTWHIPTSPVIICGSNGSGKTNILEAISLFGGSTGLRKAKWAHIPQAPQSSQTSIYMERHDNVHTALTLDGALNKEYFLNGVRCARHEWSDVWSLMWLTPEHDRLFLTSPESRRQTLDRWVYAFYPEHAQNIRQYEKLLRDRQVVLQQDVSNDMWLTSIEQGLAERAYKIHNRRNMVLESITREQHSIHHVFPRVESNLAIQQKSVEDFQKTYAATRHQDKEKGTTQCGPHRTDWCVSRNNLPASLHSTGEQKMMVLTLFLSTLLARSNLPTSGINPSLIVLLDDIASHLDSQHRSALMECAQSTPAQVWISGTDEAFFQSLQHQHLIRCGVEL